LRAARAAALSALLASLLATAGCFKPHPQSGAYFCSASFTCPGSLVCDTRHAQPLCVSSIDGGLGGSGGEGGAGGEVGTGGTSSTGGTTGMDAGPDAPCLNQVSGCSAPGPDAGMCDPVCNTGCGQCSQKCSVNPVGGLTCNQVYMPGTPLVGVLAGPCQTMQTTSDPSTYTDNCQEGSTCVDHNACRSRCYRICRANSDCAPGASCSIDAGGGHSFCEVPVTACNPISGVATSACPTATQSCYLSSDTGNTVCDCYNTNTGFPLHHACQHARDCFGGLTCTDPTGSGTKECYKVCRLPGDGGVDLTNVDAGEMGCSSAKCTAILLANRTTTTTYGVCPE
jgi:hypothetical protein